MNSGLGVLNPRNRVLNPFDHVHVQVMELGIQFRFILLALPSVPLQLHATGSAYHTNYRLTTASVFAFPSLASDATDAATHVLNKAESIRSWVLIRPRFTMLLQGAAFSCLLENYRGSPAQPDPRSLSHRVARGFGYGLPQGASTRIIRIQAGSRTCDALLVHDELCFKIQWMSKTP